PARSPPERTVTGPHGGATTGATKCTRQSCARPLAPPAEGSEYRVPQSARINNIGGGELKRDPGCGLFLKFIHGWAAPSSANSQLRFASSACRTGTVAVDRVAVPFPLRHCRESQRAFRSRHGDCIECEATEQLALW